MHRTTLAAATALCAALAAPAHAELVGSTAEEAAELTLNVWSRTAQLNYVLDLGITLGQFQANGSSAAGYNQTFNVGALLSGSPLAGATDALWAVSVFDTRGDLTPLTQRLFTTVETSFNPLADPANPGFDGDRLQNATASWFSWIAFTAGRGTHLTAANGESLVGPGDPGAYFLTNGNPAGTFNNNAFFNQGNRVGTASSFYFYTGADQDFADTPAAVSRFGNSQGAGAWTFNGTTLAYNLAPVPEPATGALLLAGLGAIGVMARRRMRG